MIEVKDVSAGDLVVEVLDLLVFPEDRGLVHVEFLKLSDPFVPDEAGPAQDESVVVDHVRAAGVSPRQGVQEGGGKIWVPVDGACHEIPKVFVSDDFSVIVDAAGFRDVDSEGVGGVSEIDEQVGWEGFSGLCCWDVRCDQVW